MWWIPLILGGGYLLKKILDNSGNTSNGKHQNKSLSRVSILEENFLELGDKLEKTNGFIKYLIIGQPGAGKSSLLIK